MSCRLKLTAASLLLALASLSVLAETRVVPQEEATTQKPAAQQGKRIAFTFDDAPRADGPYFSGAQRTRELIAALDRAGITGAMIFVQTDNIASNDPKSERITAYVEAGHRLGNHSASHPWARRTSVDDYLADIDRARAVLARLDGVSDYFRYPYLDEGNSIESRDALRKGLAERGLRNGYVTVDNYDWYMASLVADAVRDGQPPDQKKLQDVYVEVLVSAIEFYDTLAIEAIGRSPAHVLLLHENDLAALFVDDLATALRNRGWTIIPAEAAFADSIATDVPDTLFNGQGRIAAIADARGTRERRNMVHGSEDEDWLRRLFIERGLIKSP